MTTRRDPSAVFVSADEGAARCMVSRDTWDAWVRSGVIPRPHVDRGQILRWHWPSVERALAGNGDRAEADPFVMGLANANPKVRRRAAA